MSTIDQLERKILQLENELNERTAQMDALLRKSEKALDQSLHAYRVDEYGFIWVYDPETQKYHSTKMRVMTPEIADKAIHTRHLADGAVTGEKIDAGAVTPEKIADKTIEGKHLVDNSIPFEKFADGTIDGRKIADNSIPGDNFPPSSIQNGKLADDAVSTRNIQTGAVTTPKIAAGAVTPEKAADGTITKPVVSESASGTFTLLPNRLHIITEPVTDVTFALGESLVGVVNEYLVQFTCGDSPTVNFPSNIRWIDNEPLVAEPGITYQVSIVNDLAVFCTWEPESE